MKKLIAVLFLLCLLISPCVHAEVLHEFTGKLGTGYASVPEKFGLDVSASYFFGFDPYFAAGAEVDFFWINWNQKLGTEAVGLTKRDVKTESNAYAIPLFFNAQLRLPELFKQIKLVPSITVGLGYAFMILNYSQPEFTDVSSGTHYNKAQRTELYRGFTWHSYASIAFQPENSKIFFTLDLGYRGAYPQKDNKEIDISGFIAKAGVKFIF